MKIELICKDYQTTVSSLLVYFECTENELIDFFSEDWDLAYSSYYNKSDKKYRDDICYFETYLYRQCRKRFKPISKKVAVHWFHGTRILDTKLIIQKGIRPLHKMTEYLSNIVDDIAQQIGVKPASHKTHEVEHYKLLIDTKVKNPPDQGPCAFLILDALIHPEIFCVNEYSRLPIYDILKGAYQTREMNLACSAAYSNYGNIIHPRSIVQIHDLST